MPRPIVLLTRRVTFAAAHRLYDPALDDKTNFELFGKCANPRGHGHNYILEITLRGPLEPHSGMLINLVEVKRQVDEQILHHVDHKNLNEDVMFLHGINPTVENLAVAFWERLVGVLPQGQLNKVKVIESENNWALYRGERVD